MLKIFLFQDKLRVFGSTDSGTTPVAIGGYFFMLFEYLRGKNNNIDLGEKNIFLKRENHKTVL